MQDYTFIRDYETSPGMDLSGVGLVFGLGARRCCASLDCAAFTIGSTIFFAYEPGTGSGAFRELLAESAGCSASVAQRTG